LIEDNDQLQSKIDARVKPIKELERLGENIVNYKEHLITVLGPRVDPNNNNPSQENSA
jgi:hypothetical protein